jgi:hypothetical protein
VALLQGGAGLAPLAIQTNVARHPGTFNTTEVPQSFEETNFVLAATLKPSSPESPSFKLSIPQHSAHEALRLASAFGVVGAVHRSGDDWTVTGSSGASLDYQTSGAAPQWYYSSTTPKIAPATASSSVDVAMPSHTALNRDALGYLKRLGFDYAVASPVYSESTLSTTGANGAQVSLGEEEVSYTVTVHRLDTDQTVSFSVNAHNALLYAQGPAFELSSGTNYPLQTPLEGVNALNSMERSTLSSPAVGTSAAGPAMVHAKITSESISLATFRLRNGTSWLLPLYTYSGSVAQKGGPPAAGTWSEIAIQPSYVRLSPTEARSVLNN